MAITPLTKKIEFYSDFHKDLEQVPNGRIKNDIARKINEEAVKESIRNLILTNKGERPFQPDLGCDIKKILFENMGPETFIIAKNMITDTINTYEPRCNLIDVDVIGDLNGNSMAINILFNVINSETPITLTVTLTRVR